MPLSNIKKLFKSTCAKKDNKQKTLMRQLSMEIHDLQDKLNTITKKNKGMPMSPTNAQKQITKDIRKKIAEHRKLEQDCSKL